MPRSLSNWRLKGEYISVTLTSRLLDQPARVRKEETQTDGCTQQASREGGIGLERPYSHTVK